MLFFLYIGPAINQGGVFLFSYLASRKRIGVTFDCWM